MSDFELWRATAGEDAHARTATITVVGEVDLATAPVLREALAQCFSERRRIVVDARQVTFLDMVGAGLLVSAAQRAAEGGTGFVLMAGPRVSHVLGLVDAAGEVPLFEADPRDMSVLCRAGHHEDCVSGPMAGCVCPCHP
ncbi:MAG TPA: STAS domain-containing protein [Acidimicrobiales bacterium]|nr:STAS domain-containing protein [Acidimicrobiales bacterium]